MKTLNKNIEKLEGSASMDVMQKAKELKLKGIDIIDLGGGEPDFDTPIRIVDRAVRELREGNTHYAVGVGIEELREGIARKAKKYSLIECEKDNIILTPGGKFGIYLALMSMINPGDEVIVFAPYWVSYVPMIESCGGIPVIVQLDYRSQYEITKEKVEAVVTDKTKALIINYPNNPTGRLLHKKEADVLKNIILKYDLYVVSDELYNELVYDGQRSISLASDSELFPYIVTVNGFSKNMAMTGWRLGYVIAPPGLVKVMSKLYVHTITGTSPFIQAAALETFSCEVELQEMLQQYKRRRDYLCRELEKIPNIQIWKPEGTFYLWVIFKNEKSSVEMSKELLERANVLGVPGIAYGENQVCSVRFCFACEMAQLKKAVERIRTLF